MLLQLAVQNLVLIERLTLELSPGFNVLTGETGAGKSMLVDALGLVLGGRASPELVRRGAREAEVEALFEVEPGSRVAAKLEAAGIPCDRELVLRRVVAAEGRSRAFANGRICTVNQLGELATDLCDIASQHESVALTDPATHLETLDAFGKLDAAREELGASVDELARLGRELEALRAADRGRAEREDFLTFQLREPRRAGRPRRRRGGAGERSEGAPARTPESSARRPAEPPSACTTGGGMRSATSWRASSLSSRQRSRSTRRSRRWFASWRPPAPSSPTRRGPSPGTQTRSRPTLRASPRSRTGSFPSRSSYGSTARRRRSCSHHRSSLAAGAGPPGEGRRADPRAGAGLRATPGERGQGGARALEEAP